MREASHSSAFDATFTNVVLAFYSRYYSPFASHVVCEDTLARRFDPTSRCLHTVRLVKKTRKSLPKWLPSKLAAIRDTWILERTILDADGRLLLSVSRNITHRANADGIEWQTFRDEGASTSSTSTFSIVSQTASGSAIGHFVQQQIENAFIAGNKVAAEKSRAGLQFVLDVLLDPRRRTAFLFDAEGPPHFSRGLVYAPFMKHAESELAGFSGHGLDNSQDRYDVSGVVHSTPYAPTSWSLKWRWREVHELGGAGPRPTPVRDWLRRQWAATRATFSRPPRDDAAKPPPPPPPGAEKVSLSRKETDV